MESRRLTVAIHMRRLPVDILAQVSQEHQPARAVNRVRLVRFGIFR